MIGMVMLGVAILVGLFLIVFPVQLAAKAMGAGRTDFLSCLGALILASILQSIGSILPIFGNLIAFILSAWAFSAILETSFWRGMGIAVLHVIFGTILMILLTVIGLSGAAFFSVF